MGSVNKRLKVLFITAWYPNKKEPVEGIFIREHAKAVQLYDDVVVLHCAGTDSKMKGLWHIEEEKDLNLTEGVPTYRVWFHLRTSFKRVERFFYPVYLYSVLRAFHWLGKRHFQPDVIHAHISHAGVPGVLIGKIYHLPVVITEHSTAFPMKLLDKLFGREEKFKVRFAFQKAQIVLPVSKALQQGIESYGIKANFTIIPNAVNTDLFNPGVLPRLQNNPKRLLFVGSLIPRKGVEYMLRALVQLSQIRDDWHLDIVGDGQNRDEYKQMVKELKLEDRITFHGIKPKSDIAEFMRQADLFILPSIYETMGCVLIESMCCGLPIISTNVGGISEIVPDFCGILVPPKDPQALMQSINLVLSSDRQFDNASIADWAKGTFGYDSIGQRLHLIYKELCDKH